MRFQAPFFQDFVNHRSRGAFAFGAGDADDPARAVFKENLGLRSYSLLFSYKRGYDFPGNPRRFYDDIVIFKGFEVIFPEMAFDIGQPAADVFVLVRYSQRFFRKKFP